MHFRFYILRSCVFACLALGCINAAVAQNKKPNILLFITDDESWLERSAYGWSKLPTPNFDRVARDGILFTNAYTSAPSCAPSRAALLTGRNFWELKQGAFIQAWLPKEFPLLTEVLRDNGYAIGLTGKGWGPGIYPEQGHIPSLGGTIYNQLKLPPNKRVEDMSPLDYTANFNTFLQSNKEQPFFFWYGSNEPHDPWGKDNWKRLEKEFGVALKDVHVPPFVENTPENKRRRANMAYEICQADRQLGEALQLLEAKKMLENTIIIVTSDNGTYIGDKGKASPYDWGAHVPLAIMWPRQVKPGRKVTDFINFADVAPTLFDILRVPVDGSVSGRSFYNVLRASGSGRIDKTRDFVVTGLEWHGEMDPDSKSTRTLTTDKYAYIIKYSNQRPVEIYTGPDKEIVAEELYDLSKDQWQQTNLIDKDNYRDIAAALKQKLTGYGLKTGDPRFTGDMSTFRLTRKFVQERKQNGYKK